MSSLLISFANRIGEGQTGGTSNVIWEGGVERGLVESRKENWDLGLVTLHENWRLLLAPRANAYILETPCGTLNPSFISSPSLQQLTDINCVIWVTCTNETDRISNGSHPGDSRLTLTGSEQKSPGFRYEVSHHSSLIRQITSATHCWIWTYYWLSKLTYRLSMCWIILCEQ